MKILFVTSEIAPYAKVGGLGDVSASLPAALSAKGHDVRVVVPLYRRIQAADPERKPLLDGLVANLGRHRFAVGVEEGRVPNSDAPLWFVRCPSLYDRPSIYSGDGDEHLRFALLGHTALLACQHTRWAPDIVHVNDWPTAVVPMALRTTFAWDQLFADTGTVLTIHNIGHQGTFGASVAQEIGLPHTGAHAHQDELRAGRFSFLLHGIMYADALTTVSPTYAREIRTPAFGVGLDGALRARGEALVGVLNGIDDQEWDPAQDRHLPAGYSADDLSGKAACKEALLGHSGLGYSPDVPVIGVVSRLAWQKGFDLCQRVLPAILSRRAVQLVVLGTGEPAIEGHFAGLAHHFPRQVAFHNGFSEAMAHLVEAGSDFFLMPSRYEPCGLNQMYSLRYGTPPIVHKTGGLADTVRQWDGTNGNGFVFEHFDEGGLMWALQYALNTWDATRGDGEVHWRRLLTNGMRQDHSWAGRVGAYERIYERVQTQRWARG